MTFIPPTNHDSELEKAAQTFLSKGSTATNVNVTVVEQRAPTDESIRIVNEIRTKVIEDLQTSFYNSLDLRNTDFQLVCLEHFQDYPSATFTIAFVFKLNNKQHIIKIPIRHWDTDPISQVQDELARHIVRILFEGLKDMRLRKNLVESVAQLVDIAKGTKT